MEMSPTVEVRHCSPTPEYPFTPEPVKHHSFAVKFISTVAHLTLLLSLVYSSPSLEGFEAIWSFPSTAVDHWRGQEEEFLAPSLTNINHYQKWRWAPWGLSAHDLKQLSLTMAMKFIFSWQKLIDSLSQPTGMLHVPWHPSCCLCDQVLQLIQEKKCKLLSVRSTKFPRWDWANTRSSIMSRGKGEQNLFLWTAGAIKTVQISWVNPTIVFY